MKRSAWVLGLLFAACSHTAPSVSPTMPGAHLDVVLNASDEAPTNVRMEISNPHPTPVSFCPYQTPFEGVLDDIFDVRAADGAELPFRGPILEHASCEEDERFSVQPGRFHTAEVNLADGYPVQAGQVYMVRYRGSSVSGLPPSEWFDLVVE